ncbi:pyridoxal-dependent decarboxylase [uncultured Roseobacter sp.]|uniref:pyridoxal phosphate-dependent decarboxylase family protein n=1 Tax=uncultured Roseobacter sp. TaxID=114847 RepID=UPI002628DBF3|nr:pyridoxal-dependent decarboxylase [uncultured Roseobacter sp.]
MNDLDQAVLYGTPTESQEAFLTRALELGMAFIEGSARGGKVLEYQSEDAMRQYLAQPMPRQGMSLDGLMAELETNVVRTSVAQSDLRYLAFPDTGNAVAGLGADILCTFLNQNLIAYDRSAPSGMFIEMELIQWLRELVGFSHLPIDTPKLTLADVGGLWTSGGNMSNHVAVLVALHAKFPQIKQHGLRSLRKKPVIILAKGIEHFSFSSAALSLGLGQDSLVWTQANSDYTTDPDALQQTIAGLDDDCEPFMVVSVAGNCRTTGLDDISAMRRICDDNDLWLHVDACHGGNLLFSDKMRTRLSGIEHAQSVSLDPHKGLFVGYPCSYVLFKDPAALEFICRYPDKFCDPSCLDLGLIMPFYGSRGFHSLKLWALIKHLGVEGIGALVERRQALNDRLVRRLNKCGWFQLLNDGSFYRTAFVFYPQDVRRCVEAEGMHVTAAGPIRALINKYTQIVSDHLYQSGEVVFDAFSLGDLDNRLNLGTADKYVAMAMAVGHPSIPVTKENAIFDTIDRIAAPVAHDMMQELFRLAPRKACNAPVSSKGPAGW